MDDTERNTAPRPDAGSASPAEAAILSQGACQAIDEETSQEDVGRRDPRLTRRRNVQAQLQAKADDVWNYYGIQQHSLPATARHFGVGIASLRRFIKVMEWPTRCAVEAQGIRWQSEDMKRRDVIAKATRLRREGALLDDIALACGITRSSVWRILKRHNR